MSELYNDLLQAFKEIAEIEKNEDLKAAVEKSEKEASQKEKDIDENIYAGKPDKKKTKKQLDKELPWNVHLGGGDPAKGVSDFNHMNTPTVTADGTIGAISLGESKLNEGTWSLPNTKDKAQELVDLLRKDIYKKDVQKLYDLVGDDSLWDDIETRRYNVPVNDLVEKYVGNFIDNYLDDNSKGWTKDSGWKEEWNIDSLKQLAPIVKRFISPKNWNIIFKK